MAMRDEGEAVPAEYQARLTADAHRRQVDAVATEWLKARVRIITAVEHFTAAARPDSALRSDLRVISRQVQRLDQRLKL